MDQPIQTYDNRFDSYSLILADLSESKKSLLRRFAGKTIDQFRELGVQICTTPHPRSGSDKVGQDAPVYWLSEDVEGMRLHTGNCMGVIHLHDAATNADLHLRIKSRFDAGDSQQFLVYLLDKVFGGLLLEDNQIPSGEDALWKLLAALMFRQKLVETSSVGLYRQYVINHHNNLRYRGKFDVDCHIRRNIPFLGDITYSTRDISFDNPLNHLIRHAMAKISRSWPWILFDGQELKAIKSQLEQNTASWSPFDAHSCLRDRHNRLPLRHPYYASHYEPLRVLALTILHEEGASPFDAIDAQVEGFLFDGSWLWEEYLNTILCELRFMHPRNKKGEGAEHLFSESNGSKRSIYPDFWKADVVIDAKYKRMDRTVQMDDLCQIITYMHVLPASIGCFIYPLEGIKEITRPGHDFLGKLNGYGGSITILGFPIPPKQDSYQEYSLTMRHTEQQIRQLIQQM